MFLDTANCKIHVSDHCLERLHQRFRLFLFEGERPLDFIKREFTRSRMNPKEIMSPFYRNCHIRKYGVNSYRTETDKLIFAIEWFGGKDVRIKTVFRK